MKSQSEYLVIDNFQLSVLQARYPDNKVPTSGKGLLAVDSHAGGTSTAEDKSGPNSVFKNSTDPPILILIADSSLPNHFFKAPILAQW